MQRVGQGDRLKSPLPWSDLESRRCISSDLYSVLHRHLRRSGERLPRRRTADAIGENKCSKLCPIDDALVGRTIGACSTGSARPLVEVNARQVREKEDGRDAAEDDNSDDRVNDPIGAGLGLRCRSHQKRVGV